MLGLITLPFRWVRAGRYGLIAGGALISGLGLWMQINGVPPAGEPVVSGLRGAMALVIDGPATVFGVFSKLGGVMALLGLLGMTVHDIAPARATRPGPGQSDDDSPIQEAAQALLKTPAGSTWQERLAAKTGVEPVERPVRSARSVLRIGIIGLVICAFLAVLAATLLGGNIGQSGAVAEASTPGQAMIRAHLAGTGAIDPVSVPGVFGTLAALEVSKFDPAIIVPWVKGELAKSLAGDQAAMVTLGSLFGGIFVLLLGIKIMFAMRRGKEGQRNSVRRISYS